MKNMKSNKVFEKLAAAAEKYEQECHDIKVARAAVKDVLGVESDKYWEWVESHPKPEYPLSAGTNKALRLWCWSETDELDMEDSLFDSEVEDFVATLREAGIETFTYSPCSTAVMDNIHDFVKNGCTLVGLCEVEKPNGFGGVKKRNAIRFAL